MASLNEYSGTWNRKQVAHLLKRTMFGAKPADIDYFLQKSVSKAVEELLTLSSTPPSPPVNNYEGQDLGGGNFAADADKIPKGQTWVNGTYGDGTTNFLRANSLKAWWIGNQLNQNRSIEEKMIVFWSNHFATELRAGGGATAAYRLIELFRKYAFSPLKTLMIEVTKNPQMLHYLNGYLNTKFSPDENYARELQELFGVGKGPGSQYTEDDVKAAAKVLTGLSLDWRLQTFKFQDVLHDTGNKQFSAFYGNKVINGQSGANGLKELDELVDMILATDECSKYICRRIYKFFVNYDITSEIETDVIAPLAAIYKSNNYDLKPVLDKLLRSEHFYDANIISAYIKTPVELMVGFCREGNITQPISPVETRYRFLIDIYNTAGIQNQMLGDPPSVAGWPAYYQAPLFYETWINSDTYPKRVTYPTYMLYGGYNNCFDPIKFAEQFSGVANPNTFIDEVFTTVFTMTISQTAKDSIKQQILLSGQAQDYYWTDAWNAYKADPTDTAKKSVVTTRLIQFISYILQSPHYQLC